MNKVVSPGSESRPLIPKNLHCSCKYLLSFIIVLILFFSRIGKSVYHFIDRKGSTTSMGVVRAQILVCKRQGMEPQSTGDGVLDPLHERAYAIKAPRPCAPARAHAWASSWIDEKSREGEGFSPSKT